ncbi:hypothetical protein V6N11_007539 [Hibiscus sabdariffa]|uniref:Uncharacterized protein n=2 Tax=Hibiscus sabdariffa TaxID=183260 RepID=A0ABR2CBF9_9ROSI
MLVSVEIPFKIQKALGVQGIKGPPYEFFHGNNKASSLFRQLHCLALTHNIVPRVIPHIHPFTYMYACMYDVHLTLLFLDTGKNCLTWQGNQAQLVISETEIIKDILKNNNGAFPKFKDDSAFLYKITGNGLVSSEGAKWARQRKLANHA